MSISLKSREDLLYQGVRHMFDFVVPYPVIFQVLYVCCELAQHYTYTYIRRRLDRNTRIDY
jgi:hypothetical protein